MSEFDAFARFYDADYGGFADDVPFYRALAQRTGGPGLELMCGSGRVLVPLARDGLQMTGIDISPALLDAAQRQVDRAGVSKRVKLVVGDVCQPLPGGPYALAFVAINSFMHLTSVEDQIAALKQIHAVLKPGGVLALDLFNPDPRELMRHNSEIVLDKIFTLDDETPVQKFVVQSVDMAKQINNVTFIYDEQVSGMIRRTVLPFMMRWLYRHELEHLLARCGFELEAVYGSYELDDYDQSSALMLAVAVRQAHQSSR